MVMNYDYGDKRLPARYWAKVAPQTSGCWLWRGARNKGYGVFWLVDRPQYVHRLAYAKLVGRLKRGHVIDHRCKNTWCCFPGHLELVTQAENMARSNSAQALKTHCPKGHPLSGKNLRLTKQGWRTCIQCSRASARAYRRRDKSGNKIREWKAPREACPRGHLYTEENSYKRPKTGYQVCRQCSRERSRERQRAR